MFDWQDKADIAAKEKEDADDRYMEAATQKAWLQYDVAQQEANIAKNTKPDRFSIMPDNGYKGKQSTANEKRDKFDAINKKKEDTKKKNKTNQAARAAQKKIRDGERTKLRKK